MEVESTDEVFNNEIKDKISIIERISSINPVPLWPNVETGYRTGDIINKVNYKEFSEYKYTFTKDKDNYYFTSIERLS